MAEEMEWKTSLRSKGRHRRVEVSEAVVTARGVEGMEGTVYSFSKYLLSIYNEGRAGPCSHVTHILWGLEEGGR